MNTPETPNRLPNEAESVPPYDTLKTVLIPVIEEQLQVSKKVVETGRVKLIKTVEETDETVTIPLLSNEFSIERVPVGQYVDDVPATRREGDTTIYPVVKEVLVTQKRLLLVEEVRVTEHQLEVNETQTVRLRREEVTIERTSANPERLV